MDEKEFKRLMNELENKARLKDCEDDCYSFKNSIGHADYFAFEDGVILFNNEIKCNNLKIIDDTLCNYIEVQFYVDDFEIGSRLFYRKLTDANWFLEDMTYYKIMRELNERCECLFTKSFGRAFLYNKNDTVMFRHDGVNVVAEINAVNRNGERTNSSTVIFGKKLCVERSMFGVEYIDVCLYGFNKDEIVRFTLKYKEQTR